MNYFRPENLRVTKRTLIKLICLLVFCFRFPLLLEGARFTLCCVHHVARNCVLVYLLVYCVFQVFFFYISGDSNTKKFFKLQT